MQQDLKAGAFPDGLLFRQTVRMVLQVESSPAVPDTKDHIAVIDDCTDIRTSDLLPRS